MTMTHDPSSPAALPDIAAFELDGTGAARILGLDDPAPPSAGFSWHHMRRDHPDTVAWLAESGLDSLVIEALTAEETRPRCTVHGNGVLIYLRGVNLNPGAEPEDMVSVRLWVAEHQVVGIWRRQLEAVGDLFDAIERGQGPTSPGDLIAKLALRLADRAEPTVAALNERIDDLEQYALEESAAPSRHQLAGIRRTAIVLRRHMFPQRDALTTLAIEDLPWLGAQDRSRIREAAERVTRLGEELDAIRDRAQVIHDLSMDRRAEIMNRQMLILSIVAAVFLPLGLLTGLLGINVGGIPGANYPWAFAIVCAVLVGLGAVQIWLFRRIGMLR